MAVFMVLDVLSKPKICVKEAGYVFCVTEGGSWLPFVAVMQCATDLAASASSIVGMPFNVAAWWPVRAMAGAFLTPLLVGIGLAIKTNSDEGKRTWPWEDRGYCKIWDDLSLDNFGKTNLSAGSTNSITGEFVGYYRACCNPQCSVCGGAHCGQGWAPVYLRRSRLRVAAWNPSLIQE